MVDQQSTFPCPCCGYLSFDQPPGSYEICEICFWEDDELQLEYATTLAGGANRPTLLDAQRNFLKFGACEPEMVGNVRSPGPSDIRDPNMAPHRSPARSVRELGGPKRDPASHEGRSLLLLATFLLAARR